MNRSVYTNEKFTIAAAFNERVKLTPDKTAYIEFNQITQEWQQYSWREVKRLAASVQAWLTGLGIVPGDRIALMLPNCVMWVAIDQAAAGLGVITVPLYPNDREDNVQYILEKINCRLQN